MYDWTRLVMVPVMVPSDSRLQVLPFVSACQRESDAVKKVRAGSQVMSTSMRSVSGRAKGWAGCAVRVRAPYSQRAQCHTALPAGAQKGLEATVEAWVDIQEKYSELFR